ncbi:MAG: roadblock/LC7 domain-containing protein [Desulfobulbaceae bacterium]|nr:roadblock/LC7 domain-containing protein [Desulfobulbaceae bacterium]
MATLSDFARIVEIKGVAHYVLVKNDGTIASHNTEQPESLAKMVLACGLNCDEIEKARFTYFVFSLGNRGNYCIFPVGNYYLGVLLQAGIDVDLMVNTIIEFIQGLSRKRHACLKSD